MSLIIQIEVHAGGIMNNIKVSVIVPIYNVEEYLEECLDSLLIQTLKEIEIIMVNDGSTDNSASIAQKYITKSSKFRLIERVNGGLSAARNSGLTQAKGEYIYFLDSDDYLVPNALEVLYNKASIENLDVIKFAAYSFEDHFKELSWEHKDGYKYYGLYPDIYRGIDLLNKFIFNNDASFPSCCLIFSKRELIESHSLKFYEGIIHEDNLFHWQLLSLSNRVSVLNLPLYCRRFRSGSITQTPNWIYKNISMSIIIKELDLFINQNPNLGGLASEWYINSFAMVMIDNWQNMTLLDKCKKEVETTFSAVKPIVMKYKSSKNMYVRLFFFNKTMFQIYFGFRNCLKNIIKKRVPNE